MEAKLRNSILCVDLGGTITKIALADRNFIINKKRLFQTTKFTASRKLIISKIVDECRLVLAGEKIRKDNIIGMGIGVPGPVDFLRGVIRYLPNIPHCKNMPIRAILENKLGLKVVVDNDVNLMALAEARIGAARGAENAICLTLGTGVGGGIILKGQLYRGSSFSAGEIGHMPLNATGPKCNCGGFACLERYIGNRVILRSAKRKLGIKNKDFTIKKLADLAKRGDVPARNIFYDYADKLGVVLSGIVNLLNPEIVVVGGGVSNAGGFLFDRVRDVVRERAMPTPARTVKIRKSKLGNDAGLIGAAILAKENL